MKNAKSTPILVQLAKAFRETGDHTVAGALERTLHFKAADGLSEEQFRRVQVLHNRGIRLNNMGYHDGAVVFLVAALGIVESAMGGDQMEIAVYLNTLAGCRLNDGNFAGALGDYTRLQRLLTLACGPADPLTELAQARIDQCRKGLSDQQGCLRLNAQIALMLAGARAVRLEAEKVYANRLRKIAVRLLSRGNRRAAGRLFEHWALGRLSRTLPKSDEATQVMRQHAKDLRALGEKVRSMQVLRKIVVAQNQRTSSSTNFLPLLRALKDLAKGLTLCGEHRSARETRALAGALANTQLSKFHGNP